MRRRASPVRRQTTRMGTLLTVAAAVVVVATLLGGRGVDAQFRVVNTTNGQAIPGQTNIIGGATVTASSYPYVALLMVTLPNPTNSSLRSVTTCTGTLIQSDPVAVVVTAAHCAKTGDESAAKAYVGRGDLNKKCADEPTCADFDVTSIITNPGFTGPDTVDKTGHDVALWVLKPADGVTLPKLTPAVLNAESNFPPVGVKSVALGWGYTNVHGSQGTNARLATTLQAVSLTVADNSACEGSYGLAQSTRANLACLKGSLINGVQTSTCQGDSGGPHMYNGVLYGVTSFGPSPCDEGAPLVATRTSGVKPWIDGVFTTINSGGTYVANATAPPIVGGGTTGNTTALYQLSQVFWQWPGFEITGDQFVAKSGTANGTDDCWRQCRDSKECWWATYKAAGGSCLLQHPTPSTNTTYFSIRYGNDYLLFRGVDIPGYGVVSTKTYPGVEEAIAERSCRESCTSKGYGCHWYIFTPTTGLCTNSMLRQATENGTTHAWRVWV